MPINIAYDTASNAQFIVSTTVINLQEQLSGDANISQINQADVWTVTVETSAVRVFSTGNIPTATLGTLLSAGGAPFIIHGKASQINLVLDTAATGDATVTVEPAISVPNSDDS